MEKVVFEKLYNYLTINNFLSQNNSGLKKNDGTVNQVLNLIQNVYQ